MPSELPQFRPGDIGDNSVVLHGEHLSVGFSAAEVAQLIKAERDGLVQQYGPQLKELAEKLGMTREAIRVTLRIVGHDDVPAERWSDTLIAIATQYCAMRQALTGSEDGETAELRQRSVAALDSGAFDDATRILNEIRARKSAVSEQRRRRAKEAQADWVDGLEPEAETCVLLGRAALGQRNVAEAHARFQEDLRMLAPIDDSKPRLSYASDAAAALFDFGVRAGNNDALAAAIAIYRGALADAPREHVPLDWAMTQNNLGNALWMVGERGSSTARLEEAVVAYHAATTELTRERVPLNWAATQNNLGSALWVFGEREGGTARLEEAVAAYHAALTEYTRERVPLNRAMIQNNLGNVLQALGERECGTARLEEAVAACRAALTEYTRERVPLSWAMTQRHLGRALRALGERESGTIHLEEAVKAIASSRNEYQNAGIAQFNTYFDELLGALGKLIAERQPKAQ